MFLGIHAQKPKVKNDPIHDDKPVHFGFSLGFNTMNYHIKLSESALTEGVVADVEKLSPGFNVHAIMNARLAENFDLRILPGISFGEREITFRAGDSIIFYEPGRRTGTPYKIESSYLEFPLLLKYKSVRLNNFRPYIIGGGNIRIDLASKKEYNDHEYMIRIKPFDTYLELGFGMDFYLTYFKFATEIKYCIGIQNLIKRTSKKGDPPPPEYAHFTDYIDNITSNIVMISFHFE